MRRRAPKVQQIANYFKNVNCRWRRQQNKTKRQHTKRRKYATCESTPDNDAQQAMQTTIKYNYTRQLSA